jgi:hypothetical protein
MDSPKLKNLFKFALVAVALVLVFLFLRDRLQNREPLENEPEDGAEAPLPTVEIERPAASLAPASLAQGTQEETVAAAVSTAAELDTLVAGKQQLTAEDLLPKYDEANEFAKQNPVSDLLKEQNFLISGYHVGVNTVMQSNKIPYHDLRSAPPIPKETVGPWSQSSYETPAGGARRQFDLGA